MYENKHVKLHTKVKLTIKKTVFWEVLDTLVERWVNGPHSAKSAKLFADAYFTMENT